MRQRRPRRRTEDLFAWLELVLTEGPFLSRPALKAQFPAGLARPDDAVDDVREAFRSGFGDWEKAWTEWMRAENRTDVETSSRYLGQRDAWVQTFVTDVLEWGEYYRTDPDAAVTATNLDASVTVQSSGALDAGGARAALVLVVEPTEDLAAPGADGWTASSIDRGAALLRASGENGGTRAPVAIVTDGRWWSLVWQNAQGGTGSGIFDGALFREEPDMRDAFWALARLTSLAGGARERRLDALFEASVASAEEITDALGNQVRASVELLVQSFSASHLRALAAGSVSPLPANAHEVYDAAVTSMMRIVFLLFAEANELLPTQQLYREAYGISDVFDRLDERRRHAVGVQGEEALASTYDTWHRLLATSRALYDGATFEDLRMPAYGGSLFDPDRFPWLTSTDEATGGLQVLVDDRVMFHVLRSVQHVDVNGEDRQVSFRELDVEQIGYVYEGLLGYSARYTDEVVVGLQGPEGGSEPEVALEALHELNDLAEEDPDDFAERLVAWVKEHQPAAKSRTARQLARAYVESGDNAVQDEARRKLRPVVGDGALVDELIGYYRLMRLDPQGLPYVVPAGGLLVIEIRSRATSGTHYTPRALAEEVVRHALEPLVYSPGPLETDDSTAWVPISSAALLGLKVADIAVGSGAFLVAAARYLADRLLDAWEREGGAHDDLGAVDRQRRRLDAVREVVAHCLYGADIDPMAIEMCKLSLWLVSLDPARPFSFVDDKILCGSSILGLTDLDQLQGLRLDPEVGHSDNAGLRVDVESIIRRASQIREGLANVVSEEDPMRSARAKRTLVRELDENNRTLRVIADGVIAAALSGSSRGRAAYVELDLATAQAFPDKPDLADQGMLAKILHTLQDVATNDWGGWRPLHWVVEIPDVVVERGGFDAVVGNPPWVAHAGRAAAPMNPNLRQLFASTYRSFAGYRTTHSMFIERACSLARPGGFVDLVIPTSVADLDGYAPTRAAVTSIAELRLPMATYGDGRFRRVFMPCMRFSARADRSGTSSARAWDLRDDDADELEDHGLMRHLSSLPPLPAGLFREVGFQTSAETRRLLGAEGLGRVPIIAGKDIQPFSVPVARLHIPADLLSGRDAQQKAADVLIRQTARFPIAAPASGVNFRNSVIGVFGQAPWTASVLLGLLNSRVLRWFHYLSFRDAREGMPQMKIGHLRKYPAPSNVAVLPAIAEVVDALVDDPMDVAALRKLEALVADAYELSAEERDVLAAWPDGDYRSR
ncbi:Eco57I restriction-modification methylase domain-containing protein [Blastococcus sp. SYSU DS0973]